MGKKIIGNTVGTNLNPERLKKELDPTSAIEEALAEAKKNGEFDGKDGVDGKDGYTPVKGVDYFDGKDGESGKDGTSITVVNVSESSVDGGSNVVTFSDGKTVTVKNGNRGSDGNDGYTPIKGVDYFDGKEGADGQDGYTPVKGKDYFDGTSVTVFSVTESTVDGGSNIIVFSDGKQVTVKNGRTGANGNDGYTPVKNVDYFDGKDGHTPVCGTDYFTEADKAEMVQRVIESLGGNPVFGYVDENNNIVVSGNLADGTYSVKYEMDDGSVIDIGSLVLEGDAPDTPDAPAYTNLADPTSDEWMKGYKIDSADGSVKQESGVTLANTIYCGDGDIVRIKGMTGVVTGLYKNGAWYARKTVNTSIFNDGNLIVDGDYTQFNPSFACTNLTAIRFYGELSGPAEDVIITVNQEIV